MKTASLTITLLLTSIVSLPFHSEAREPYLVECKTKNLRLAFTTLGEGLQSERNAVATFYDDTLDTKKFKLTGKHFYSAYVEQYKLTLKGYPSQIGDPINFVVSIKLFGDEPYIIEKGLCQAI